VRKGVEAEKQANDLRLKTQTIEQAAALKQFDAANASRLNAQNLEAAATYANMLANAAEREAKAREAAAKAVGGGAAPQQVQPRFAGGPVKPGQLYTIAERGPELVNFPGGRSALVTQPGLYTVPSRGYVHTAAETARMMAAPVGVVGASGGGGDRALLDEVRSLKKVVKSRKQLPPAQITVQRGDDADVGRMMRSISRGNL
jgi:hypothetical protein